MRCCETYFHDHVKCEYYWVECNASLVEELEISEIIIVVLVQLNVTFEECQSNSMTLRFIPLTVIYGQPSDFIAIWQSIQMF